MEKRFERRSFHYNPKEQLFAKLKQERACENKRGCSSEKEHKVNALAPRAEEGRDYLRKAAASWK